MKTWILIGILLGVISCKTEGNEKTMETEKARESYIIKKRVNETCPDYLKKRKKDNLNISILLDLSGRIDSPGQQAKDSAYISLLSNTFNDHVRTKKLGLLHDKIEVFFEPAPQNSEINKLSDQLKISYVKGVSKKEWIPRTTKLYAKLPTQIYKLARVDAKKQNGYPGSDIWRFFKDHVKDYAIESCSRNVVVILTDGYMYFNGTTQQKENRTAYITSKSLRKLGLNISNWETKIKEKNLGFLPATSDLEDLEVLVIGIENQNPENPYTQDILQAYWSQWFEEMGVKRYKIKDADLPSNMEKVIQDFIL